MNALILALLVGAPTPTLIAPGMPTTSSGVASALTDEHGSGQVLFSINLLEAVTAGVGSPNVLTSTECGKTITNEGATAKAYNTLPAAAAAGGCRFTFHVQDADDLRITAATGDTIRFNTTVSITGGYAEGDTIGEIMVLESINATEWLVTSLVGTWDLETS